MVYKLPERPKPSAPDTRKEGVLYVRPNGTAVHFHVVTVGRIPEKDARKECAKIGYELGRFANKHEEEYVTREFRRRHCELCKGYYWVEWEKRTDDWGPQIHSPFFGRTAGCSTTPSIPKTLPFQDELLPDKFLSEAEMSAKSCSFKVDYEVQSAVQDRIITVYMKGTFARRMWNQNVSEQTISHE
ncbi:hypothetical protein ANCCAN_05779 [Ancylostoma caninum]|uniref:C-type lectin domain-containing protein n=1 Tax=Ancylostoma caninum TaxID=29170 RepID=A0A368GUV2_ANCCA|nr:hypothetical protein ANCCAN_05779 [Ancylostoma caninum]